MNAALLQRIVSILDHVYGAYSPGWKPKPYLDNKSRYLWTDAYGVTNFLSLYAHTKDAKYLEQADALIQDVHDTLGKTRDGSRRLGNSTDDRPLLGGLRIGKPQDEGSGMSQDGQYYHYLVKWMFALNRMALLTSESKYNDWAVDLVKAVHSKFTYGSPGNRRMYWKMSMDLSRPLVPSEGQGDTYDAYVTYRLVDGNTGVLKEEIEDAQLMVNARYKNYYTDDTLGIGSALWLCGWFPNESWAKHMYSASVRAAEKWWKSGEAQSSMKYRLAFREFGLTIGVQLFPELAKTWNSRVAELHEFWKPPRLYERDSDITPVMYCTSLFPGVVSPHFQNSTVSANSQTRDGL